MKKIITLLFLLVMLNTHAQFRETKAPMSKGVNSCLAIFCDTINKTTAHDAVIKVISEKDPSIISFNELFFDNVNIPTISVQPTDIYVLFTEADKNILLFADLGTSFIDSILTPNEFIALKQLAQRIKNKVIEINKQNNIDSLKLKIKQIESRLDRVNDDLKEANNQYKNNTKGAAKDDKQVLESEAKIAEAQEQIKAIDSLHKMKEKEFNAFPLEPLKTIVNAKNNALDKNRSTRKSLIKSNLKSLDKITEYETEIQLNKASMEVVKDDAKATKNLNKSNQKLGSKIGDERLKITLNIASIKAINTIIANDSTILKINQDSLDVFDEDSRRKELRQMENKKEKLVERTLKNQANIQSNTVESQIKKQDAQGITVITEELIVKQKALTKELEDTRLELLKLEKK